MSIDFQTLADFIGIVAFAVAGILAADGKRFDPVGIFVLAFTTAFGGGLFRDIVLGAQRFYWIENEAYVWLTVGLASCAPSIVRRFRHRISYSLFIWCDAVGLGFFSVSGTALSLSFGVPLLASTILGVCTGVMGGMVRDVLLNKVPMVLSDRQPYASSAFLGCWVYIGMMHFDVNQDFALWFSTFLIIGARMFCWYQGLDIIRYGLIKDIAHGRLSSSQQAEKTDDKKD